MAYENNTKLIWAYNFFHGLMFFIPIFALYLKNNLSSVFLTTLILGLLVAVTILAEVPAGAVTDAIGRKKSLLLSSALSMIALVCLYYATLPALIFFAIIQGLAKSFMSGSDSALLYDSLDADNNKSYYKKAEGVANALWPLGAAIGSITGGFIAATSMKLAIIATLIPLSITLLVALALKEPPLQKEVGFSLKQHLKQSIDVIKANKQIIYIMTAAFFLFSSSEVVHELKPLFFELQALPIEAFGVLMAATFLLSSIGSALSHTTNTFSDKNVLIATCIAMGLCIYAATMSQGYLAASLIILPSLFWGVSVPIRLHLLNDQIRANNRATIMSVGNLISSIGFLLVMPLIGYLADAVSITFGFQITAALLLGAIASYAMLE